MGNRDSVGTVTDLNSTVVAESTSTRLVEYTR